MTTSTPKQKPRRKPAPPPPAKPRKPFTGEVARPPLRTTMQAWGQRQKARGQRAKDVLGRARKRANRISRGQAKQTPSNRQQGSGTRPARRRITRPRKRSTIFAVLTVAVAALALTAVVIELTSTVVATGLFTAAEGVSFATAWWMGEPSSRGPVRQRQRPGSKQPASSGGCSPACQHGKPEKASECKCSCGGTKHGIKRAGGGSAPNTSKPAPRKRRAPAKPAQSPPTPSKPPGGRTPRAKPAPKPAATP